MTIGKFREAHLVAIQLRKTTYDLGYSHGGLFFAVRRKNDYVHFCLTRVAHLNRKNDYNHFSVRNLARQ